MTAEVGFTKSDEVRDVVSGNVIAPGDSNELLDGVPDGKNQDIEGEPFAAMTGENPPIDLMATGLPIIRIDALPPEVTVIVMPNDNAAEKINEKKVNKIAKIAFLIPSPF